MLTFVATLTRLYIPGTRRHVSLRLGYQLRAFTSLFPLGTGSRANEDAFAAASLHLTDLIVVSASARKPLGTRGDDAWRAAAGIKLHYEW